MPTYVCTVHGPDYVPGQRTLAATSVPALATLLREQGLTLVRVAEDQSTRSLRGRVAQYELNAFFSHLAASLRVSLPLVDSLRLLAQEVRSGPLQLALQEIIAAVSAGSSFADALAQHPRQFSEEAVALVRAGEASGALPEALEQLAEHRERIGELTRKVAPLFIYPAVVSVFFLLAASFLLLFIVPKFIKLFEDLGMKYADFPYPTLLLIALQKVFPFFLVLLPFVLIAGLVWVWKWKPSYWELHLPFCGELYRSAALARMTSTLALLINQGVPLVQALYLAAASAGNRVLERALYLAAGRVLSGASLSDALKESEVLPPTLTWRIGAAAESGSIVSALRSMTDLYLRRVDLITRAAVSVMEPLLVILLGGCLFFIMLGIFAPLITITSCLCGGE